jgi:hypothetical protein
VIAGKPVTSPLALVGTRFQPNTDDANKMANMMPVAMMVPCIVMESVRLTVPPKRAEESGAAHPEPLPPEAAVRKALSERTGFDIAPDATSVFGPTT